MSEKKGKYLTKTVKFGDAEFTLFSIDGITWSSKKEELEDIKERHERQRQALIEDTKEYLRKEKERKAAKVGQDDEDSESGRPRGGGRRTLDSDEDIEDLGLKEVSDDEDQEEEGDTSSKRRMPVRKGAFLPKKGAAAVAKPMKRPAPKPASSAKAGPAAKPKPKKAEAARAKPAAKARAKPQKAAAKSPTKKSPPRKAPAKSPAKVKPAAGKKAVKPKTKTPPPKAGKKGKKK